MIPFAAQAVVFDCDGLLLETESRWTMAEEIVCDDHGAPFSMDLKRMLLGSALDRAGVMLAEWCGAPPSEGPRFGAALIDAYRLVVDREGVEPMPGVVQLLESLAGRMPLAVASNTAEPDTRRVLARSGLPDVFEAVVCAGGPIPPKPAPDLYLSACAALGSAPERSVAFEDSPLGASAATAAGMFVVGVPSTVGVRLSTHHVVDSLERITAEMLIGDGA